MYNSPNFGMPLTIFLPASDYSSPGDEAASLRRSSEEGVVGGTETIFVIEDEELVANHVSRMLRRKGYTVLVAHSGVEALQRLESHDLKIDLVLSDVIMPGMNGRELVKRISAKIPTVKVLYMSGYPEQVIGQHGVLEPGIDFIEKPFYSSGLLEKIREVLDKPQPA